MTETKLGMYDYPNGEGLYQFYAKQKLTGWDIPKGRVGGWVRSLANISDDAWAGPTCRIKDNARLEDKASIHDGVTLDKNAIVEGEAEIIGNALITDNARVGGEPKLIGNITVSGDSAVCNKASVLGACEIRGRSSVEDNAVFNNSELDSEVTVCGNARVINSSISGSGIIGNGCYIEESDMVLMYGVTLNNVYITSERDFLTVTGVGIASMTLQIFRTSLSEPLIFLDKDKISWDNLVEYLTLENNTLKSKDKKQEHNQGMVGLLRFIQYHENLFKGLD